MGVMMLDGDDRQTGPERIAGRKIIWMRIRSDAIRSGIVEADQVRDHALERGVRLRCFQIADVLTYEDLRTDGQGHAVLQVRADGQHAAWRLALSFSLGPAWLSVSFRAFG